MKSFYYEANLKAGVPSPQPFGGLFFVLWDCGVARQVDLIFTRNSADSKKVPAMTAGFQINAEFDSVTFISSVDTSVKFFASNQPISLGSKDTQEMKVRAAEPLPVLFSGTVAPVLGEIRNTNERAVPMQMQTLKTVSNNSAITLVSANVAVKISDDATLKRLRICNRSDNAVIAIGGQNITVDTAVILLQPNDIWLEDDAAQAEWYAVSATANAKLTTQGVK